MYVESDDHRSSCNFRRSVIQEFGFVQLELADLLTELAHLFDIVLVQNPQVALNELDWTLKVKIKAESNKNIILKEF